MSNATLNGTGRAMLNALEPNLSLLASQAAIELDNCLLKKPTGLDAVRLLAKQLDSSTEAVGESNERQALMDAPTASVLSSALDSCSLPVQTLAELADKAWEMANDLQNTEPTTNTETIQQLRSFCVFLATNARSLRRDIQDMQATHAMRG
ncbi:MAG: hypothetical protein JW888_07255 [Pirellulales bacterium]|nr:hypothetical protein [Pirellulales bacterium]